MQLFGLTIDTGWIVVVVGVTLGLLITMRRNRSAASRAVDTPGEFEHYQAEVDLDEDDLDEDVDPELEEARERRDDALARHDYPEARRWAEVAVGHQEEDWLDLVELGTATALDGEQERGWQMVDEAVEQCERADARMLPSLLVHRAISFLMSGAPTERFVAAVEEADRASPRDREPHGAAALVVRLPGALRRGRGARASPQLG